MLAQPCHQTPHHWVRERRRWRVPPPWGPASAGSCACRLAHEATRDSCVWACPPQLCPSRSPARPPPCPPAAPAPPVRQARCCCCCRQEPWPWDQASVVICVCREDRAATRDFCASCCCRPGQTQLPAAAPPLHPAVVAPAPAGQHLHQRWEPAPRHRPRRMWTLWERRPWDRANAGTCAYHQGRAATPGSCGVSCCWLPGRQLHVLAAPWRHTKMPQELPRPIAPSLCEALILIGAD
mmetsp:Transcript_15234/g.37972  ORF Transcript_15234/g.37972 Transcript_15234/m.37972 type:complete len:238 (-) Transcript_15234:225-938(-)